MEESKIYNYRFWIKLTDEKEIVSEVDRLLREADYGIMNFSEHHFQPQGYTSMWLLSESHCALHTFPEEGRSYIELSGCGKSKSEHFIKEAKKLWKNYLAGEQESIS